MAGPHADEREQLAQRIAAALVFVVGEERGSDGARAANQLPATSKWLINGEPTESLLASGCKGAQRVIVRTHGREAHSAYAHLGDGSGALSRIRRAESAAERIRRGREPEETGYVQPGLVNVQVAEALLSLGDLTAAEVRYLMEHEWAREVDDVLWRRTKMGLRSSPEQRARLAQFMAGAREISAAE